MKVVRIEGRHGEHEGAFALVMSADEVSLLRAVLMNGMSWVDVNAKFKSRMPHLYDDYDKVFGLGSGIQAVYTAVDRGAELGCVTEDGWERMKQRRAKGEIAPAMSFGEIEAVASRLKMMPLEVLTAPVVEKRIDGKASTSTTATDDANLEALNDLVLKTLGIKP